HRSAAVAGGPPPGACPRRGPHPLRERHRPSQAAVPRLRHQPRLVHPRGDRHRPHRLAATACPARRTRHRRTQTAALPRPTHRRTPHPRAPPPLAAHPRHLSLGRTDHRRVHHDRGNLTTRL